MTKKPSYRFAGYTESWEEKKLGVVAEFTKGKGYSKGDLEISGVPIILYGRLYTNYQTIIDDIDTYVTMKENSVLSEGNEIIVPSSGESSEEISRASVVSKSGVILGGDLNIIKLNATLSSVFVAITLSNGAQQKELSKRAQGKSVVHLHNSDLKEVNLSFPSLPEQTAIGSFFQDIDQLISLQQRKLEVLKEQKKTYLKLLFPAKGQTKPALRFAGFEDEWKEKYLYEVLKVSKDRNVDLAYDKNQVLSVSREAGVVNQIEYQGRSFAGADLSNYKVVNKENLIYTKSPLKGAPYGIFQISYTTGIVSPLYAVFKSTKQIFAPFVGLSLMDDNKASKYLSPIVTKGAKNTINITDEGSLQGKLLFPSMEEQRIIHTFFQDLDKSIAKQEEKVNQLKESKQTLLRKMFI